MSATPWSDPRQSLSPSAFQIAAQVLAAVVPAWLAGGGALQEVVGAVVAAAPGIPSHRRLAIFTALVDSLPKVGSLLLMGSQWRPVACRLPGQPCLSGVAATQGRYLLRNISPARVPAKTE